MTKNIFLCEIVHHSVTFLSLSLELNGGVEFQGEVTRKLDRRSELFRCHLAGASGPFTTLLQTHQMRFEDCGKIISLGLPPNTNGQGPRVSLTNLFPSAPAFNHRS